MVMAILRIVGLAQLDLMAFQISAVPPLLYSILEPAIGISVACIPLLQPLIKDTWLGDKLAARGTNRSRRAYKQSSGMRRLEDGDNELRLFKPSGVSISTIKGTNSEIEDSEVFHTSSTHSGITKTSSIVVNHIEPKSGL